MASTPASVARDRQDTKTLVRLGGDRDSARLPSEQSDVLRDIAQEGDATGNRVQLWFKGLAAPVRARVRVNGERIRLETLLPFLELDSEVTIARDEEGPRLHARIAQVSLVASGEQSVPRLSVEVAVARDSVKPDAPSVATPVASAALPSAAFATTPPASAQGSRLLPWLAAFVLGAAGGAAGTGAWLAPWLRAPFAAPVHRSDVQQPRAETAPMAQPVAAALAAPIAVAAPVVVAAEIEPVAAEAASAPSADIATPEAAPEAASEAALEVAAESRPEVAAPEAEPVALAAAAEPAPAEPAAARGLEIESAEGQTEIFIPMQGSAEGMERYALTTPGVSFTLPHARALIAISNYVVQHRPLVRRVWLRAHATGVQVRIILPRASIHDETRFDADGLHIILRP